MPRTVQRRACQPGGRPHTVNETGSGTRRLSGAFEHTGAILDSTRVSPYRPAAVDMPQSMRPDTRQHLTACTEPSQGMSSLLKQAEALAALGARLPRAQSPAAVNPLRGSFAPLRPFRVTAAANRAGSPCGPARRLALVNGSNRGASGAAPSSRRNGAAGLESTECRTTRLRNSLHLRRRPHTTVAGRDSHQDSHPLRSGAFSRRTATRRLSGAVTDPDQGAGVVGEGRRGPEPCALDMYRDFKDFSVDPVAIWHEGRLSRPVLD